MIKFATIFLVFALALMVGCSSKKGNYKTLNDELKSHQEQDDEVAKSNSPEAFDIVDETKVAPGYSFHLSHPNDKELSGNFRVAFDSMLQLPYKIRINTKGLTITELISKVQNAYRPFFSSGSPGVNFSLHEKKFWVEVGGLVNKSGKYLVSQNTTFDELISLAQGISGEAKTDFLSAQISQGDKTFEVDLNNYYRSGDSSRIPHWHGADVIFIKKAGGKGSMSATMVKMLGEVRSPGEVPYIEGADLYYYLTKAGGQTNTVDVEKFEIIRTKDHEKISIVFNPSQIEEVPVIQAGDVITLYPFRETKTEKVLRNLSYLGTIIMATAILIIAF